jgi:hypothetical protein
MIKIKATLTATLLLAFFHMNSAVAAENNSVVPSNDIELEALNECKQLAVKIFSERSVNKDFPQNISNVEYMFTWHAGCAERPPTGKGNVTALCQAQATKNGQPNHIFYWQKIYKKKLTLDTFGAIKIQCSQNF